MAGERLSLDELKGRLGLPENLARRIGALRALGLEVSPDLLEEAVGNPALQEALLSSSLLEKASSLDSTSFQSLGSIALLLQLVERDGVRHLVRVPPVSVATRPEGAGVPAASFSGAGLVAGIREEEARHLFPPEQLAQLKLTLLTGVDSRAKIEALRRLTYAPLSPEEKGALTLRTLGDPDPEVRREAALGLHALGLDRSLAEALSGSVVGTPKQRASSLERVGGLAGRAPESEQRIALSFLISGLRHETDLPALPSLLRAMEPCVALLRTNPESLGLLTRNLVRLLVEHFDGLSPSVRKLYDRIAEGAGPDVATALWREIEPVGDRRLRHFLLSLLCPMAMTAETRAAVADFLASEFARPQIEDLEARQVQSAARHLGDDMVDAVVRQLDAATSDRLPHLITVLDGVAAGGKTGAEARNRAVRRMISLLAVGDRSVRAAILESTTPFHSEVDPALRSELAGELIQGLHAHSSPRFLDLAATAIRRLGVSALPRLRSAVESSAHAVEREIAVRLMAEILSSGGASVVDHAEGVRFLRTLEDGKRIPPGLSVRCVGLACRTAGADPALVRSIHGEYQSRLYTASFRLDLLAALASLAASPVSDPVVSTDTAFQLTEFLQQKFPDLEFSEEKGEEGIVLQLGRQTQVYTEVIPEVLGGLRAILGSGRLPSGVTEKLLDQLLERFQTVSTYREVWAPGNVVLLAETLVAAATAPTTALSARVRVIGAVMPAVGNLALADVLSRAFDREEEKDPAYVRALVGFVGRLVTFFDHPGYQELQDRRRVVEILVRMAGHPRIAPEGTEDLPLREQIVEWAVEHRVTVSREGRESVARLLRSPHLPEGLRSRLSTPGGGRRS